MLARELGSTGLTVSALGFGAGHIDRSVLSDRDTARGYRDSEERLGRYLEGRRDGVVLSTKVGYDVPEVEDWSAAVGAGVERALRLLRTEVLDVVFLHSCNLEVLSRGYAVKALLACRDAGMVRVAGYSGENTELRWAVDSGVFGAVQTSVNLADQASLRDVLPLVAARGVGVVAKRPIANAAWRHASRPTGTYGEPYWERLRAMGLPRRLTTGRAPPSGSLPSPTA